MTTKHRWRWIYLCAALAAFATVLAYVLRFSANKAGGPAAWGEFGDFVGGVLNPIFGLVTIVLLVESLVVERAEAEVRRLTDRLDSTMKWWSEISESPVRGRVGAVKFENVTFGELFRSAELKKLMSALKKDGALKGKSWPLLFADCLDCLEEVAQSCAELDQLDPTTKSSRLYNTRIITPTLFFGRFGFVTQDHPHLFRLYEDVRKGLEKLEAAEAAEAAGAERAASQPER
jgi:hypothetical protein